MHPRPQNESAAMAAFSRHKTPSNWPRSDGITSHLLAAGVFLAEEQEERLEEAEEEEQGEVTREEERRRRRKRNRKRKRRRTN